MQNVFEVLKEMKIIWKQWNSSYIYKCQTGIPLNTNKSLNSIKSEVLTENNTIKFFLHFSAISGRKEDYDFEGMKSEGLYLVSFIWIKGSSHKYLDFASIFKLKMEDKI